MLRTTRPLLSSSARAIAQSRGPICPPKAFSTLSLQQRRPRTIASPLTSAWRTEYSTKLPSSIDKDFEKQAAQKKLVSDPAAVTTQSSVRHAFDGPSDSAATNEERDISRGVKQDLKTIKETLALSSVPKEPYALGLAGTLPYLATSVSTLFLGWNMNTQWPTSSNFINSFLLNPETASAWLSTLEQIQLGYGAVIISFLGAIHWGLEFGEKKPEHDRTRFRYGMGVLAPAAAWPTLFMPVPWALTSQFLTFTALYMADVKASTRGWAPSWYPTYRFILTAVVGGAIFISLVGRAKSGTENQPFAKSRIVDQVSKSFTQDAAQPYEKWRKLEEEEKEKNRKAKEEEERKKEEEKAKKKGGKKGGDKKGGDKKGGDKKEGDKKDGVKKDEKQGKENEKQEDCEGSDDDSEQGDEEQSNDSDEDAKDDSKDDSEENQGDDDGKDEPENEADEKKSADDDKKDDNKKQKAKLIKKKGKGGDKKDEGGDEQKDEGDDQQADEGEDNDGEDGDEKKDEGGAKDSGDDKKKDKNDGAGDKEKKSDKKSKK